MLRQAIDRIFAWHQQQKSRYRWEGFWLQSSHSVALAKELPARLGYATKGDIYGHLSL
jgi:hypothetical protein